MSNKIFHLLCFVLWYEITVQHHSWMYLLRLCKFYENNQSFKIQHNRIMAFSQDRAADVVMSALQHPPKGVRAVREQLLTR